MATNIPIISTINNAASMPWVQGAAEMQVTNDGKTIIFAQVANDATGPSEAPNLLITINATRDPYGRTYIDSDDTPLTYHLAPTQTDPEDEETLTSNYKMCQIGPLSQEAFNQNSGMVTFSVAAYVDEEETKPGSPTDLIWWAVRI